MRTLYRLAVSTALAAALCQAVFLVTARAIARYRIHHTQRLQEVLGGHEGYSILFVGSSRMRRHVDPRVIDRVARLPSFNSGTDGGNLYEMKTIFEGYLVNHPPPALLVLALDAGSLDLSKRLLFDPSIYFPYASNPPVATALSAAGISPLLLRLVPFAQLGYLDDSRWRTVLDARRGLIELGEETAYKGFLTNGDSVIDLAAPPPEKQHTEISPDSPRLLEELLDGAGRAGTRVILTYAPEYRDRYKALLDTTPAALRMIEGIARSRGVPFLRHDKLEICLRPELFANAGHLNTAGAAVYSEILGKQIREFLDHPRTTE